MVVDERQVAGVRLLIEVSWCACRHGLGDWTVSEEVWPDGLGPLVDAVTSRGMQFGLWVEPEMVNPDSDLARAHPDWVMQVPGHLPPAARHQQVVNLTIPECYDHIRDALVALLAYEPDDVDELGPVWKP